MPSPRLPARYRRPAVLIVTGAAAVAVVVASLAWPGGAPGSAIGGPSASGSPGPASSGGSTPVQLKAIGASGPIVAIDTRFSLSGLGSMPAAELANRLVVEPSLDLTIEPGSDGTVDLTPSEPLVPGAVYHFTLLGPSHEELESWAFQAEQPLRVVETLPGNEATDVPLDSGIEITFDQDGVTDAASHVTVEPATKGRFEEHGRVLAFVPEGLTAATLYTVTVSRGVTVQATGESTAEDVRFQFETVAKGGTAAGDLTLQFQSHVIESAVGSAPAIAIWGFGGDQKTPATARLEVYRLPGLEAAIEAFRRLRAVPGWSRWSSDGLVSTADLPKVLALNAKLNDYKGSHWVSLPDPLPAGWYLLQLPTGTRPSQAILQVTDVAAYMAVSETRTLVWANDLATKGPIAGAAVATSLGELGRTDSGGMLMADTPSALRPAAKPCPDPCEPVVTVTTSDGRSAFLPGAGQQEGVGSFDGSGFFTWDEGDPRYWVVLSTDRTLYRPSDTINVWGVLRDRDSGQVPAAVKLLLVPPDLQNGAARPPVSSLTIEPGPTGAFTGSFNVADLPAGSYSLSVVVDKKIVRSASLQVAPILKPAYRLEVETGRRIYIAGDQIRVTVRAKFFEGTPVPGVPLRLNGAVERGVTTDQAGTAIHRMIASADDGTSGPSYKDVSVSPARPEEGEIGGASRDFMVYPASRTVDATSQIADGRVRVAGGVHRVDVDRLENEVNNGASIWDLDPRGGPVSATTVTAQFIELIPVRTRTGTEYDFITKKAVPVYNYDTIRRDAGTVTVKTNAKGEYSASIAASGAGHDYQVELTIGDPDGHRATTTTYASAETWTTDEPRAEELRLTDATSRQEGFGIGEAIDLTMADPGAPAASAGRYLFFTAQRGLRDATVQASSRFQTTFESWAAPNLDIGAIRFTGAAYVDGGWFHAGFRQAERRLDVDLSVASPRYAPGGSVTVDVTTRNAKGSPVAATVIMRAVDEKLFSIGGAIEVDALSQLYRSVGSGIFSTYQSHLAPLGMPEGGDTTGGGGDDRFDFRDSLLFKTIETGADGHGSVTFKLSDDLTSWRVSASAITADLEAGDGSVQVPVGLPFFVDAAIATEYLAADQPTIQVRAFGSALEAGAAVTINVTSSSLKFASKPISTTAFATVGVPLPALTAGAHDLTISATSGSGTSAMADRLTRRFTVVDSRLARTRTDYVDLAAGVRLEGGNGPTTVVLSDAGVGRHLTLLAGLASEGGARLDQALAADLAASLLTARFGSAAGIQPIGAFASDRYQTRDGGLALLPYGSSQLELSALVAIVAPEKVEASRLRSYLEDIRATPAETRERQMYALAGLAGLSAPVLPAIQAAAANPDLTVREKLVIGIGAAALGDAATARSIAASLTRDHREGVGQQARLRVGESAGDMTEATALMAVLSAAVGDPNAASYWAYVQANPSVDQLHVLHAVAYVERTLDRLAARPASFAYTLDGAREVVELGPGESFELTLTAAQRASLKLETLTGAVGVTTSWREPIAAASFEADPDITMSRSITPGKVIGSADLVRVDLTVKFGSKAPKGCHQVIDLLPSGLVAVGSLAAWIDPDSEQQAPEPGTAMPYAQTGQRVFFCAEPYGKAGRITLRYYARVVTPGTFVWEPAVLESKSGPNRAAITPQVEISIR
jgi:hypothetical protein